MKTNSTTIKYIIMHVLAIAPLFGFSQFNPGLSANFGIDGDVYSGQSQNISGSTPQGSFDWFKSTGSATAAIGIIDTVGTGLYASQIAAGNNVSFTKGMAFSMYSAQNGYLLLDARYARDNFGGSPTKGLGDSTTFVNGSKNGDNPSIWTTAPLGASVADKSDIIDSYVAMLRDGTTINNTSPSHLIMAMGVSTVGNTGNRYVDVELYRSRIAYDPSTGVFSNSGPSATGGHTSWTFNANGSINTIGDLTVSFTYGTGGVSAISVYVWVSQADFNSVSPQNFSFVSAGYNGSTYGYAQIVPSGTNPFNAWGSVSSATTPAAPWGTNSKSLGSSPSNYYSANYGALDFGEVALDLTSMGIDPALSVGMNPCAPPYTRVMIKSRASSSFTSALQDFSGPYSFLDAPVPSAQITTPAVLKCNVSTVTLSPASFISGSTYQWTTSNGNIVSDPTATSITVNKPGKYYLKSAIVAGCNLAMDSITVGSDYYQPVATASATGVLITSSPEVTVTLNGGDTTASKYSSVYESSTGVTWNWSGPNGISATTQNIVTNKVGTYTLVVTELSNGCKDTAVISLMSYSVLAVKLGSFDATLNKSEVDLKWTTESQENVSHYVVQRSLDGKNFKEAGVVFSNGNSITAVNYSLTENISSVKANLIYYRLCAVTLDGKIQYSEIRMVRISRTDNISILTYPNPVTNQLRVTIPSTWQDKRVSYELYNAYGQLSTRVEEGSSSQTETINVSKLTTGMYIVKVICEGQTFTQKVIKN